MAPQVALRRAAAVILLACCAPLLGCAGSGGGPASTPAPDRSGRFEGWYQGQQIPSSTNGPSCRGQARGVWFEVDDGTIEMRSSRRRRGARRKADLWGTVAASGELALRQAGGKRSVVGRIDGDRLTAADVPERQTFQGGDRIPCFYRYEATRRPGGSNPGHDGNAAAAASVTHGPPPI